MSNEVTRAPVQDIIKYLDFHDRDILFALAENPGLWVREIGRRIGGSYHTLLKHLRKLEEYGLVKKVPVKLIANAIGPIMHRYYLTEYGKMVVEWLRRSGYRSVQSRC